MNILVDNVQWLRNAVVMITSGFVKDAVAYAINGDDGFYDPGGASVWPI
jgi:hypothetical protein